MKTIIMQPTHRCGAWLYGVNIEVWPEWACQGVVFYDNIIQLIKED